MSNFFRSGKRFNIIFSILLAVLLWFYVVNVENPSGETTISAVPVVIQGADVLSEKGLMVTELSRDTINVKAVGKRKTFLKLYKNNITLGLDVSSIEEAGEHRIIGKVMPDFLRTDSSISLSERENFAITVTVKKKSSREIPVSGTFDGTLANGYDADPVQVTPSVIEVSGPEDLMEQISHAIVVITGEGIKESIQRDEKFVIMDQSGNPMDQDTLLTRYTTVQVTMHVMKLYEIPLTVKLNDGGGAVASDVTVDISPSSVKLTGADELLAGMKELSLGEFNLADVFSSKSKTYTIPIPEGASKRSSEAEAVVTITVDLPMKSIAANQISIINAPKGYQAALVTDTLQVWVRGKQESLDQVSAANLRVVVDLTDIPRKKGQQRAEASVYLDGFPDLGVVGADYSVAISMK